MEKDNWSEFGEKIIKTELESYLDSVYVKININYKYIEITNFDIQKKTITMKNNNIIKENMDIYNSEKKFIGTVKKINGNLIQLDNIEKISNMVIIVKDVVYSYSIKKNEKYLKVIPDNNNDSIFILFENNLKNNIKNQHKGYINTENIIIFLITFSIGFIIGNNIENTL